MAITYTWSVVQMDAYSELDGETNGVLQALGTLPFAQVAPLIGKIRAQDTPQFEAAQAVTQV